MLTRFVKPSIVSSTWIVSLTLLCLANSVASGQTVLLDTFEDDTVGQAPNGPEIGNYNSPGVGNEVVSYAGRKWLRSSATAPIETFLQWQAANPGPSRRAVYRYVTRLDSASSLVGADALEQRVGLRRSSPFDAIAVFLGWGEGQSWSFYRFGGPVLQLGNFSFDTDYEVVWEVDFDSDSVDLLIGGVLLVDNYSLALDLNEAWSMNFASDDPADVVQYIDDVRLDYELLFADGFEHGSPGAWSSLAPAALVGDECELPGYLAQGIDTPGTLAGHTGTTGDDSSCASGAGDTIDRWLLYTAQCDGDVTVSTCNTATEFDTVIAVYAWCGGFELACNDDSPGGEPECDLSGSTRKSKATFQSLSGQDYWIRVSVFADSFPAAEDQDLVIRAECAPTI